MSEEGFIYIHSRKLLETILCFLRTILNRLIESQMLPLIIGPWIGLADAINPTYSSLLVHVALPEASDIYLLSKDWVI